MFISDTNVVFSLLNVEAMDYIGSSRLVYDLNECNFHSLGGRLLKFKQISSVIEIGQVGEGELYIHSNNFKDNLIYQKKCFVSSDNVLLGRNGTRLFEKNEIIRNIFITVEPEDTDIFLKFYNNLNKPRNLFFNFVPANSPLNIINQVIAKYEKYCALEQLTEPKMNDLWLNFYIIPSIVFQTTTLDEEIIDKIKNESNKYKIIYKKM